MAAKAGQQIKVSRKPQEVPEAPSLTAHAPKGSIKFADSDDEEETLPKKRQRDE